MTFDILLTSIFVWSYCAGIGAFLLVCIGKLTWFEVRPLNSKLKDCKKEIDGFGGESGFANEFERYDTRMEESFGTPWKEFVETLVLPTPGSDEPIRNTQSVSRYLNDTSIIFPKISFDFYRSVPNLLTGFGILGTFAGLATGVGAASAGLTSGDSAQVTESLRQLLSGASLAFVTSVVGISSSMIFVFFERRVSRKLHLAVDDWVKSIESCVNRVTSEGVALDQLEQAKRATHQLEKFNTDLIFSLEQALEEKIAGRLSPQLDRLVEAVQELRADRSSDAGRMIEQVLGQFTDAMQERTGSQFEEMATIITDLNRTLKESADGMAQSQREIKVVLDEVVATVTTSMDAGASAMTETLQQSLQAVAHEMATASSQLADQLATSSHAAAAELEKTVGAATNDLAESAVDAASRISGSLRGLEGAAASLDRSTRQSERVLADMTTFVDRINVLRETIDMSQRRIADAAAPIARAAREIGEASDRTANAVTSTNALVDRIDSSVNKLEQHQSEVTEAWTRYQDRFEGIDSSLALVFQQIDEGLSGYCEQVKEFANELDRTTSKTIQELGGATHELSQSIEDLTANLGRQG